MEYLKLLGIVIIIVGFALKLDSILIIVAAALVTAIAGGLSPVELLETLGSNFLANRSMAIFIIIMLVTGTLERNGLREAAAALIGKFRGATSGLVIGIYGVMRAIFAAFNVGFGGVAGVCPSGYYADGGRRRYGARQKAAGRPFGGIKGHGCRDGKCDLVFWTGTVCRRFWRDFSTEYACRAGI